MRWWARDFAHKQIKLGNIIDFPAREDPKRKMQGEKWGDAPEDTQGGDEITSCGGQGLALRHS